MPHHAVHNRSLANFLIVQGYFERAMNISTLMKQRTNRSTLLPAWLEGAAINRLYAERHGYVYQLYIFSGPSHHAACFHHSKPDGIISNWCRFPALLHAMTQAYPTHDFVMYLDSDAFIRSMWLRFADFMANAKLTNQTGNGGTTRWSECTREWCRRARCSPTTRRALDPTPLPAMWAWINSHWGCTASTGTLVVRNVPEGLGLLDRWWAYAGNTHYASCREGINLLYQPYEQGALLCHLYEPSAKTPSATHGAAHGATTWNEVEVISDDSFRVRSKGEQYIVHPCRECTRIGQIPPIATVLDRVRNENNVSVQEVEAAAGRAWQDRLLISGTAARAVRPKLPLRAR